MKGKFSLMWRVLIAMVLALSLCLVTAVPAFATGEYGTWFLASAGDGAAAWSTTQVHDDTYSAAIGGGTAGGGGSYGRVWKTADDITLDAITAISFWHYLSSASQADNSAWPIYEQEGQTYTDTTAYLSPYVTLKINSGSTNHWLISQPFARDPDGTWTAGWEQWQMTDNAALSGGHDPTEALWHDEAFSSDNASTGGAGAYPTGWEYLSHWQTTYTGYDVVEVKVSIGEWAFTTDQTAYVDDITITTTSATTYAIEPRVFNGSTPYGAIQTAIDAASSSDNITVASGTFKSGGLHVHTQENLTITSVSGAAATIISGATGTDKIFEIGGHSGNTADGFTLDGFTLSGYYSYGVYLYTSGFDIKNNIITGTRSDGIVVTNPSTGPPPDITSGAITGNTVTGLGASILDLYRPGILLESTASGADISGITITGNTVTGFGTTTVGTEAAGIRLATVQGSGVTSNITVTGNTVSGNYIGLHLYGASTGLEIYSNTMTANNMGVALQNSGTTDISSTFDMFNNTITSNTGHGVRVIQTGAENITGAKDIQYNTFSGNGVGITNDFTAGTDPPVVTYNYWGKATGPYHATTNPGVSGYRGDTVSDYLTYAPWLYLTTAGNDGDSVANIVTNEVPAYANSVVLSADWNTFSVPITLDGQYNTWAELVALTSLDYSLAYRFNPTTQLFESLGTTDTDAVAPGEGFYIKMDTAGSIPYCYSTVFSAMPSRDLGDGFNLISGGMTTQDEIITLVSIATVGSTAGYTQVISTAENAATAWVWYTGVGSSQGDFVLGEGYWVFLPIDRTLGLFDPTPVTWVATP